MTKCKECGAEISTKAEACPKCGAKVAKTSGCAVVILGFLVLILASVMLVTCGPELPAPRPSSSASVLTTNSAAPAAPGNDATREALWVEEGKRAVLAKLKDPDSAQFRDVYFHRGVEGVPLACGQVNSKNAMGGYGGFQHFISAGSPEMTFLEEQMEPNEFTKVWNQMCANSKK